MTVVLMYHSLYNGDQTERIDTEDLPYAVSTSNFIAQLDALANKSVGLLDNTSTTMPDVVITFDDGHVSNFDIAMPLLAERGLNAYLFVTGDFIDKRAHFCSASHLRKMVEAGMEIGSHGMTHRFFDDLSNNEADRELRQSMQQLSDQCGAPVQSISFPGGRYNQRTLELCRSVGYGQLFGSAIGTVQNKDLTAIPPINRVAIRRSTTLDEFNRIINADTVYYTVQKSKQSAKSLVKRTLGNRLYHGLYKSLSAR